MPKDRRKAARVPEFAVRATYWTGGVCRPLRVRDISESGAYIETEPDWCVGTLIHLVLECEAPDRSSPKATFWLWARIVHADSGGMGVQFMKMERERKRQFQRFLETAMGGLETGVHRRHGRISAPWAKKFQRFLETATGGLV
jgi:Tfp pilus assembly protein PilZ